MTISLSLYLQTATQIDVSTYRWETSQNIHSQRVIYVCVYACTYVCMYVRTYVCMYVCMYVHTYVCMYVCNLLQRELIHRFGTLDPALLVDLKVTCKLGHSNTQMRRDMIPCVKLHPQTKTIAVTHYNDRRATGIRGGWFRREQGGRTQTVCANPLPRLSYVIFP